MNILGPQHENSIIMTKVYATLHLHHQRFMLHFFCTTKGLCNTSSAPPKVYATLHLHHQKVCSPTDSTFVSYYLVTTTLINKDTIMQSLSKCYDHVTTESDYMRLPPEWPHSAHAAESPPSIAFNAASHT